MWGGVLGYLVFLPILGVLGVLCGKHGGGCPALHRPQHTKVTISISLTSVLWPLDVPTPLHPAPGKRCPCPSRSEQLPPAGSTGQLVRAVTTATGAGGPGGWRAPGRPPAFPPLRWVPGEG